MKKQLSGRLLLLFVVITSALSCAAENSEAEKATLRLPPYKKVLLNNGMTLLLMEQHKLPLISFSFIVGSGSASDPVDKQGLASLAAGLLRKGTSSRSAEQAAFDIDSLGGTFSTETSLDYTTGSAEFMTKDLAAGLDILTDLLLNPKFPEAEVAKRIHQAVDEIKSNKDEARLVINNYFSSYFYGSHPYGKPAEGTEVSLPAITRSDVVSFYSTNYRPAKTILAVAGDFSSPEMENMLKAKLERWVPTSTSSEAGPAQLKVPVPTPEPFSGKKLLLVDKPDSTQTFFTIGNLGISRTNPDRVAVGVVNTLFGGRFTSLLNSALRVKSGLTYGARSVFPQHAAPGVFFISSYTKNQSTEKAIDLTLEVLRSLHERGVTPEELDSAKQYLKGQFPPRIETTDALATRIAQLEFYGLDRSDIDEYFPRIDAVNMQAARQVIQRYFPLDNLVFVLIGKAGEIEPVVKKYAPRMDKKSITDAGY